MWCMIAGHSLYHVLNGRPFSPSKVWPWFWHPDTILSLTSRWRVKPPEDLLPEPPGLQELVSHLGRICKELPMPADDRAHTFSVHNRLSASSFPMVRQPIWSSIRQPLVPEEREGLGDAHHHLQRAVRKYKSYADACRQPAPIYQPGQKVWVSTRDIRLCLPCQKLSPKYIGPFQVIQQINSVTYGN